MHRRLAFAVLVAMVALAGTHSLVARGVVKKVIENCYTGGTPAGWSCSLTGRTADKEWCEHRANQICDPNNTWNNDYDVVKNVIEIRCTKSGQADVVCCECLDYDNGCCSVGGTAPACAI